VVRLETEKLDPIEQQSLEASMRLARGTGEHSVLISGDELDCLVHDLRGPLLAMRHELALIDRLDPAAQRSLRAVRGNLEYLERLLQDVTLTTRPDQRTSCSVALLSLVEAVVARLPAPARQRTHVEALARVDVNVDPVRIERVISNLLDNALRHADGAIVIRLERAAAIARVSVIDGGPGMSADVAAHVFERHVHGDCGGDGLGLYLARDIVESYGGRIHVETSPGEGARFYFELAAISPAEPRKRTRAIVASSILCGASVLLVDDDVTQLRALAEILRSEQVSVVTATSAPECLIRAAAQRPEVIVLDLSLPGGDAVALTRSLSALDASLPVILMTGLPSDHPSVTRTLEASNAWFLPKPFEPGELFIALEQALIAPRRTR
jgi:CheY-like chemotaxis protein